MDTNQAPALSDEEIERILFEAAIEEARQDPRPSIPDEVIQEKLLKKMAELQLRIDAFVNK